MTAAAEQRKPARPRRDVRHWGREAVVQMLYQWEIGGGPIDQVVRVFWAESPSEDADEPSPVIPSGRLQVFAGELAAGVVRTVDELDPVISAAAEHWRIERMATIDRIILRLAVYEFVHEPAMPARVVINEALELARTYSSDEAIRFINGMLDGIRRTLERE
jgi:N utilization substance protein B